MGEIDVIGLPGIDFPWHFTVFLNIVAYKLNLPSLLPWADSWHSLHLSSFGIPTVSAICAQAVAGFAVLALVSDMAEIDRLGLLRIEQIGKTTQPKTKAPAKPNRKKTTPNTLFPENPLFSVS